MAVGGMDTMTIEITGPVYWMMFIGVGLLMFGIALLFITSIIDLYDHDWAGLETRKDIVSSCAVYYGIISLMAGNALIFISAIFPLLSFQKWLLLSPILLFLSIDLMIRFERSAIKGEITEYHAFQLGVSEAKDLPKSFKPKWWAPWIK